MTAGGRIAMTPRNVARVGALCLLSLMGATLTGGTAYAYWTSTGTGSGTASARTFQPVTVSAGSAPSGQLYPGLVADGSTAGGDLVVTATNPNPFPVTVTLTQSGPATGCTTTGVTLDAPATFALPASSGATAVTLAKVLSMSTASSNDCQGATITVPLTTSSQSA